jgi:iron complex transport system permease protein
MTTSIGGPLGGRLPRRGVIVLLALLLACALVVGLSLATGSYGLTLAQVWATLTGNPPEPMAATVVFEFRLPRVVVALFCGGMLALSGAVLQALTRNGLADPSLLGVSQGAALAVVGLIVLMPEAPHSLRTPLAFLGAIAATLAVQAVATGPQGAGPLRLILAGVGLSAFLSALIGTMLTHGNLQEAQSALGWLAGSVNAASWAEVRSLCIIALLVLPAAIALARPLSALRFGPEVATGLGLSVRTARGGAVMLAVLAAAAAVAAVGPLGFVGLIAPHMAARLARTGTGLHLANSAVMGALVVALADLLGRTLFAPVQIPAGLVTALIGVPVFAILLLRGGALRDT